MTSRLNIRLGTETHDAWMDYCEEQGIVSAEEIRQFIEQRIVDRQKPQRPKLIRRRQKKRLVKLWLTESEIEGIRLRTMLNSGTRAGWIIKVVRAALARQPVFDDAEVQALKQSTDALNAIGRNLNQIAKSMHKCEMPEKPMQIERVERIIRQHTGEAEEVVNVARSRWIISA